MARVWRDGPGYQPTFTLVHEYRSGRLPLFHMDFYRLETEKELDEIGFDDYLANRGSAHRVGRPIPRSNTSRRDSGGNRN